jgi:charged multivesicular body protein 1
MVMEKFEQQFEDMDVQTQYMEGAMNTTTTLSTPQGEVDLLMQQVADEHGLELNHEIGTAPMNVLESKESVKDPDELTARLAKLRNP